MKNQNTFFFFYLLLSFSFTCRFFSFEKSSVCCLREADKIVETFSSGKVLLLQISRLTCVLILQYVKVIKPF